MKSSLPIIAIVVSSCTYTSPPHHQSDEDRESYQDYRRQCEQTMMDKYAKVLMEEGRMPYDFADKELVLGRWDWHDGQDGCSRFGMYSFDDFAYNQARQCWWIHGCGPEAISWWL